MYYTLVYLDITLEDVLKKFKNRFKHPGQSYYNNLGFMGPDSTPSDTDLYPIRILNNKSMQKRTQSLIVLLFNHDFKNNCHIIQVVDQIGRVH